jgi:hypothetical protein
MTAQAVGRKRLLMVIGMAGQTFSAETKICEFLLLYFLIGDELLIVAVVAGFFCMRR